MFVRSLPLVALMFFILICVVWRGWLQYRRYGNFGIVLFQSRVWYKLVRDAIFALLFFAVIAQSIVFAWSPASLSSLSISMPSGSIWIGAVLMAAGSALTVAAQLGMGVSWRIGIDEQAAPGLVTSGLYQFCRNPIYLGMIVNLLGMTMMLTTWLSLALTVGVIWCVRSQTIEEEVYLERTYGAAFRNYASAVGRFWPGLGKLPAATA